MAKEQLEAVGQAPVAVEPPPFPPAPRPHQRTLRGSSLREERNFFRIVGALFVGAVLLALGFATGQQYTISQVETAREAGMKMQFERRRGVKHLFDSLVGEPEKNQPAEREAAMP